VASGFFEGTSLSLRKTPHVLCGAPGSAEVEIVVDF
jgi:hypothetical protein